MAERQNEGLPSSSRTSRACSCRPSSLITRRVARAAAHDAVDPPNVLNCKRERYKEDYKEGEETEASTGTGERPTYTTRAEGLRALPLTHSCPDPLNALASARVVTRTETG